MTLPAVLPGFEHVTRYLDQRAGGEPSAKIGPGEYYLTRGGEKIVTVLGSCVSACIRDPIARIAGMNHFMLPSSERDPDVLSAANRFGNFAMESLVNGILSQGGKRERLEVKLAGGGKVLQHMTDIGERNIAFVREYVRSEGLNVAAEHLGGRFARRIYYYPETGRVRLMKISSRTNDNLLKREDEYRAQIGKTPVAGDVDLF